jgi:hypothetical protein
MTTMTGPTSYNGGGIVKTIILPNEEVNRLGVEAEELRCFLSA